MAAYPPGAPPPYGAQMNYPPPPQMPPQNPPWGPSQPMQHPYGPPPPQHQYGPPPPQQFNGPPPPPQQQQQQHYGPPSPMPPQRQQQQQLPPPQWQPQPHPSPAMPPNTQLQILPTPSLIFTGAQADSLLSTSKATISLLNAQTGAAQPTHHVKLSKHSKPHLEISRLGPSGEPSHAIGSATFSSLSGSITLDLPGSGDIKMSTNWSSMSSCKDLTHPVLGALRWESSGMGNKWELRERDGGRRVLCQYRDDSLGLSRKSGRVEIFVAGGGDALVDMLLVSAIAVVKGEEREAKKAMKIMGDFS